MSSKSSSYVEDLISRLEHVIPESMSTEEIQDLCHEAATEIERLGKVNLTIAENVMKGARDGYESIIANLKREIAILKDDYSGL